MGKYIELTLELEVPKKMRVRNVDKVFLMKNKICYERSGRKRCYNVNNVIVYAEEVELLYEILNMKPLGNVIEITSMYNMDLIITCDKRAYVYLY